MANAFPNYWPSARHFTEAIQCPGVSFSDRLLRETVPAVDRLGMPLVTSGQFAYVYKLKSRNRSGDFAVRCFRGYLGDRDQRYMAIQSYLQAHPLPLLSGLTYQPQGILAGGQRFPIIFMKWIEGPTLDLYLEEMIDRRDVLLHLTREWLRLISILRDAGTAHGDLQHGNVIIERGSLRLVDHDGLFVPEMTGWLSSELGHQHYQHPRRDATFFDATLDNFSALSIYLSLIALVERPRLWREHHDENLLFTKADFLDPATSNLFGKIREIGPEHCRLADILAAAAVDEPAAVPHLLDLVSVKSALPSWMSTPLNVEAKVRTREAAPVEPALQDSRWQPWTPRAATLSVPATPSSSTVQTIFGGPAAPIAVRDPSRVLRNTPTFAKELLTRNFVWWYWGIYAFLMVLGLDIVNSLMLAVALMASVSLVFGFIRARQAANAAMLATAPSGKPLISPAQQQFSSGSPPTLRIGSPQFGPASITASDPIVANRVLGIYHLQDCKWVEQIPVKNRVAFRSTAEALSAGLKPCRVCSPLK